VIVFPRLPVRPDIEICRLLKLIEPLLSVTSADVSEKLTVEPPALKVPLLINNGPEVPLKVIVELFAVKVPGDSILRVPVVKALSLPVLSTDVAEVSPLRSVSPPTITVPARVAVRALEPSDVGSRVKLLLTVKADPMA